jgi:hypothetical protein
MTKQERRGECWKRREEKRGRYKIKGEKERGKGEKRERKRGEKTERREVCAGHRRGGEGRGDLLTRMSSTSMTMSASWVRMGANGPKEGVKVV